MLLEKFIKFDRNFSLMRMSFSLQNAHIFISGQVEKSVCLEPESQRQEDLPQVARFVLTQHVVQIVGFGTAEKIIDRQVDHKLQE